MSPSGLGEYGPEIAPVLFPADAPVVMFSVTLGCILGYPVFG
jgi:hypothetical protein